MLQDRIDELAKAHGGNRSQAIKAAILRAVAPEAADTIPSEREVLLLLSESARAGNVTAIKGAARVPPRTRTRGADLRPARPARRAGAPTQAALEQGQGRVTTRLHTSFSAESGRRGATTVAGLVGGGGSEKRRTARPRLGPTFRKPNERTR